MFAPAVGTPVMAGSATQALSQFVDGVQTYQAHFTQTQTDDRGDTLGTATGTMALARPGKFRWQVETGGKQLIVTDGSTLWLYDEDLKQVTIRPASEALQGTPAAMLSQKRTLTDTFEVADEGEQSGVQKLRLMPRAKESDFKDVTLWLRTGAPVRMLIHDQLGGATDIIFSEVRSNTRLDAAQFRFVPPKGVEVVEGRAGESR
mgnify:CR=1 FL=1